jgi:hypothetical protein
MPKIKPGPPAPILTPEQRAELRHLHHIAYKALLSEPEDIGVDHPAVLALLTYWEGCKVPWNALPTVPCYHARDAWLVESIASVLAAIAVYLREP